MKPLNFPVYVVFLMFIVLLLSDHMAYARSEINANRTTTNGYVAEKDNLRSFFDALSARINKPIIVSQNASKKRITGNFDTSNTDVLLKRICVSMGLIWYDDGQSIYIYDNSEVKSVIITLKTISPEVLKDFLVTSALYDSRFPLRSGNSNNTFYLSGPPVYIKLISEAADYLDRKGDIIWGNSSLNVIPLRYTFVNDRVYRYRNETISIPGMATIIQNLTGSTVLPVKNVVAPEARVDEKSTVSETVEKKRILFPEAANVPDALLLPSLQLSKKTDAENVVVVANPDNNSLLVRGTQEQVNNIKLLVASLDLPRRHIEMSVWIVDLQKEEFDQLGIDWQGSFNLGGQIGISFNGGSSTVDGASFMASVRALEQKKKANVVSRPMILTQENIPAVFDNNRTFYTKLLAEREAKLESITYGTSVNVLPRFTQNNEVELLLTIEDGSQYDQSTSSENILPEVGRTNISTIARVPKGKSLLVGGYTRHESIQTEYSIPGLKDIPFIGELFRYHSNKNSEMVRVFLIQPKEIKSEHAQDGRSVIQNVAGKPATGELFDWMNNFLENRSR